MLTWLLARLPSVTLARDLAVAREREAALTSRVLDLTAERTSLVGQRDALQRRYDRLVEARLLKDGAITVPLSDPPKAPAPRSPFGTAFTRMVNIMPGADDSHPEPVGDAVGE